MGEAGDRPRRPTARRRERRRNRPPREVTSEARTSQQDSSDVDDGLTRIAVASSGTPELIDTEAALADAVNKLRAGTGPFSMDAERAAGFRYSSRAYLVQIKRHNGGLHTIDPIALAGKMDDLADVLSSDEWILHAATQDLPCLRELNFHPPRLFDTELAGRLLGRSRVGLGTMLAEDMGISLAKEHSASDWSVRPISPSLLDYAALDVEYLIELRAILHGQLEEAGKLEWALQEFEHERTAPPRPPRAQPWRRLHGIGDVRSPRGLAVVREMWTARDNAAREQDIAPGKLINDRAIAALAARVPLPQELPKGREWRKIDPNIWKKTYESAMELDESELPARRAPSRGNLPDPRNWGRLNAQAASRLPLVKNAVYARADELNLPQENLLSPSVQRAIAWDVSAKSESKISRAAETAGARPWQIEQSAASIAQAINGD